MSNMHIFDRSNLDENVMWSKERGHMTRRDCLETYGSHRRDIVLVNTDSPCTCTHCGDPHTRNVQTFLEVTPTGFSGTVEILDTLTPEQYLQVQGIASRMRENAISYPPAAKLLAR